jgi:hypothetical protein
VLGASVVALLLNPYGWRLLWNPIDMILNQKVSVATISEWKPLELSSLEGIGAVAAIAFMVIANCIRGRKWKVCEMAFVFLAWYSAFSHHRFTYLAAILTSSLLARDIARSFCEEPDEKTIPAMNAVMVAGALIVMFFMYPSEASLKEMLARMFPLQTIASIQPQWRTLDWDYVGGMMAFEAKPSFIDSRYDSFEHAGVLQEYRAAMYAQGSFELLDKYRVDHVLIQEGTPLSYLLQHTPCWQVQTREKSWDGHYALYTKIPSATTTSADCGLVPAAGRH